MNKLTHCLQRAWLLGTLLLLASCQQTYIDFTQAQKIAIPYDEHSKAKSQTYNLPEVVMPKVSKQLDSSSEVTHYQLTTANGKPFQLHLFPQDETGLMQVNLVALSPNKPYREAKLLNASLFEIGRYLANLPITEKTNNHCGESLNAYASLHMIKLSITCPNNHSLATVARPLVAYWRSNAPYHIDTDKVSRNIKLNKHIGAFSGGEIEKTWRQVILGKHHSYNQILDDETLVNELSSSQQQGKQLQTLLAQANAQSQWHLLITSSPNTQAIQESIQIMSELLDSNVQGETRPQPIQSLNINHAASSPHKSRPKITLIDAPNTVQTQMRVGYRVDTLPIKQLSKEELQLGCISMAALLGRSYSGRLFYDLREQRGLTYGIYASCLQSPLAITFKIQASTQLQHTGAFILGILDHLAAVKEDSISQAELSALRTYIIGQNILKQDNPAYSRGRYIDRLIKDETRLSQDEIITLVEQLSPQQLQGIAKVLFANRPQIVLRGDADKIMPDLRHKLANWPIEVIDSH